MNKGQAQRLLATVEFQDADGFQVDTSTPESVSLAAGEEKVLTGAELVTASVAGRVMRLDLKLRPVR